MEVGGVGNRCPFFVKTDNSNNVLITGYYGYNGVSCSFGGSPYSCAGVYDLFVEKFSASGVLQWVRTVGSWGDDIRTFFAVDENNNVCMSGEYWSTMTIRA